ncbi:MAG: hypothetical protein Q7W44_10260 [Coriobacteriia bacterium]|nr:hypothetical protein [Coriobacteriia bacterium]
MIKAHMDLTKGDKLLATLTWHKIEDGKMLDIGHDFSAEIDEEMKKRIIDVCEMPLNITQNGVSTGRAYPGSSKHFEALPKHLERLGVRVRCYY